MTSKEALEIFGQLIDIGIQKGLFKNAASVSAAMEAHHTLITIVNDGGKLIRSEQHGATKGDKE